MGKFRPPGLKKNPERILMKLRIYNCIGMTGKSTWRCDNVVVLSKHLTCDMLRFVSIPFFMAALWNRAGHYIFALWFLISFFFFLSYFFFSRLISAVADWMSTILLHMVRPHANLECRSEMCCAQLAGNA